MVKGLFATVAVLLAAISPVHAETWRHPHVRLAVPDKLAGLPRGEIRDVEKNGLDVALNFEDAARNEYLTIYVFRKVAGDVPVWFDRAITMMKIRPQFANAAPTSAPTKFVPPGQSRASGLRQFFSVSDESFKSTGIAVIPMGEWYVKFRLTSKSLTPAQLSERLDQSLAAITWPAKQAEAPEAVPLAACPKPLTYVAEAKAAKRDETSSTIGAMLGGVMAQMYSPSVRAAKNGKDEGDEVPDIWCRDGKVVIIGNQLPIAAVYQRNTEKDTYMLALGDSGRALIIEPNTILDLTATKDKPIAPGWRPTMIALDKSVIFEDFDGLASPEQLFGLLENGKVISTAGTFGANKGNVTVNTPK